MVALKDNCKHIDCHRNGERFDVEQNLVIHHRDGKYPSKMKNISITGVMASVPGLSADNIHVGDTCGVSFCTDLDMNPGVYSSRVTRIDPSGIALHFLRFII